MLKRALIRNTRRILHRFGYEIYKLEVGSPVTFTKDINHRSPPEPPPIDPIWPLPRDPNGLSDEAIRAKFAQYHDWFYAFEFEPELAFSRSDKHQGSPIHDNARFLQQFRHIMPFLIESQNGSLKGKRMLDVGCNAGFWSIQCALLGAEVVGFDAKAELIEQANLIKSIVGIDNVEFRVCDFWHMSPDALGGTFDVVFSSGVLYHLPKPLQVLELTKAMARKTILLDTAVSLSGAPIIELRWEEPYYAGSASVGGIVAFPSKSGIELMLRSLNLTKWFEIPIRTRDMPSNYLDGCRAAWLIDV